MDFEKVLQILAIVFGAGGLITGIASYLRSKAQNQLHISTAWEKFSAPLLQRIEHLEKITAEQETTISDLRGWAERLAKQVIDLGGEPVPFIPRARTDTEYPKTQE